MAAPIVFRDNSTCVVLWVWIDEDPTAYNWVENFPLGTPLVRTDTEELYYKTGSLDTDWTLIGGGGASGVDVEEDGVAVVVGATIINFTGAGGASQIARVTDAGGGQANVQVAMDIFQSESPAPNVATALRFDGTFDGTNGRPIGLDLELVDDEVRVSATLSGVEHHNTQGQPAVEIDLEAWVVQLVNDGATETVAPFTLPTPGAEVREITIVNGSDASTKAVSVAVANIFTGLTTFTGSDGGDSVTFVSYEGSWYVKNLGDFVRS